MLKKTIIGIAVVILFLSYTTDKRPPAFRVLIVASLAKDHIKMMDSAKPFFEHLAMENNFSMDFTKDTSVINDSNLARYQVFVQLQLAPFDMSYSQQDALQKFIESGKGWVGIHAAGLTGKRFKPGNKYWQWFEDFMGGVVYSPHPAFQKGTLIVEDRTHPATIHLPPTFEVFDEWYEFDKSPRGNVRVLATADESTYKQNKPMGDHPMIWANEKYPATIYISTGHDASLFNNPSYVTLLKDAIVWSASKAKKD